MLSGMYAEHHVPMRVPGMMLRRRSPARRRSTLPARKWPNAPAKVVGTMVASDVEAASSGGTPQSAVSTPT